MVFSMSELPGKHSSHQDTLATPGLGLLPERRQVHRVHQGGSERIMTLRKDDPDNVFI